MAKTKGIKKKKRKKATRLQKQASQAIKRRKLLDFVLSIVLILVIVATAGIIYASSKGTILNIQDNFVKDDPAAVVNQDTITMRELEDRYNLLPPEYKQIIPKEDVLSQMIEELILLQEANKKDITVSEEEIDEQINTILMQNQISYEEFEETLKSRNLSIEEFKKFYEKEIKLTKLINQEVLSQITVSDVDIQDYYYKNEQFFGIPASANASHILICHEESERCESNISKQEAEVKVEWVKTQIEDDNFAEIAFKFSDEPAAQVTSGNLGWISEQSPFDKTFLNATFDLTAGEISDSVETVFGYHIIKVFERREADMLNLSEVYDQINQTLLAERQSDVFVEYISELKNNSEIITFFD
jgi:parvulin-like peptidyl-prolyl isomerase